VHFVNAVDVVEKLWAFHYQPTNGLRMGEPSASVLEWLSAASDAKSIGSRAELSYSYRLRLHCFVERHPTHVESLVTAPSLNQK
jgi:hypothetical protein